MPLRIGALFLLPALCAVAIAELVQQQPYDQEGNAGACTAIALGLGAMEGGGVAVTQTVDCLNCDFRLARVARADNAEATAPKEILRYRAQYPREVSDRAPTWQASNLDPSLPQTPAWASEEYASGQFTGALPPGAVDDALRAIHDRFPEETWAQGLAAPRGQLYASIEALYGIVNEKQVAVGESTCAAMFGADARKCPTCEGALFDIAALSRVAMERCDSARCAIELMGAMAETYGYYGAEKTVAENGESLGVSDKNEAWVFHVLPDDTSTSAIWAAQLVPPGHVAPVANAFIIRSVPRACEREYATLERDWRGLDERHEGIVDVFRCSGNMHAAAKRSGLLAKDDLGHLDFKRTFGARDPAATGAPDKSHYSTLRRWRVFALADPSIAEGGGWGESPRCNYLGDGQPFSAPVAKPLSVEQVLDMHRDLYEGTPWDLTRGPAGGPYGDPTRFDGCRNCPDEALSSKDVLEGQFPRAISMFRTSWSIVAQSRRDLPDEVGAMAWFGQYAPHASAFVPVYVAAQAVPPALSGGSLFRYDPQTLFWSFAAVGNFMRLNYRYMARDVAAARERTERVARDVQAEKEKAAADLLGAADSAENAFSRYTGDAIAGFVDDIARSRAAALLQEYTDEVVQATLDEWNALLPALIAKYHDGYVMHPSKPGADPVDGIYMEALFYPKWWLRQVGYWTSIWPEDTKSMPASLLYEGDGTARAAGSVVPIPAPDADAMGGLIVIGIICGVLGAIIGIVVGQKRAEVRGRGYDRII